MNREKNELEGENEGLSAKMRELLADRDIVQKDREEEQR